MRASELQWGRRLSSTESGPRAPVLAGAPVASMGPPTVVDGETKHVARWAARVYTLQWGRRLSSTESPGTYPRSKALHIVLQWGRRLSSTERVYPPEGGRRLDEASMGPPTVVDGEVAPVHVDSRGDLELQWGRRLSSTER